MLAACKDWFLRGLAGWIALPVLFVMIFVAIIAQCHDRHEIVQLLGAGCDLAGVCLVAADLCNIYRKHRVAGPISLIKSYFLDFPLLKRPRQATLTATLGNVTLTAHGVRMRVGISPDATQEQKVDYLMRRFAELEEGQQNQQENLAAAERRLTADIAATRQLVDRHRTQVARRLRSIEIGDLFLTPLGLLYVAVGAGLNVMALLSF